MFEFILARYNYWIVIILMMMGLYIVFSRGNLVKKVIGLNIFQTSVFIFYITIGKIAGGTAPIYIGGHGDGHGEKHDDGHGDGHSDTGHGETGPGQTGHGELDLSEAVAGKTQSGLHAGAGAPPNVMPESAAVHERAASEPVSIDDLMGAGGNADSLHTVPGTLENGRPVSPEAITDALAAEILNKTHEQAGALAGDGGGLSFEVSDMMTEALNQTTEDQHGGAGSFVNGETGKAPSGQPVSPAPAPEDHGASSEALPDIARAAAQAMENAEPIYSNPLPHVLILTAIVVGVATTAVGLALAVRIREAYGTIEEDELEAADDIAEFGEARSYAAAQAASGAA